MAEDTIVVPTDFSSCSAKALELGAELARKLSVELLLLHTTDVPEKLDENPLSRGKESKDPEVLVREAARLELERLAAPLRERGVSVTTQVEFGDASTAIMNVADAIEPLFLVMGTHGRTGLAKLLLGSVTDKIVKEGRWPVLTVPFSSKRALNPPLSD